MALFIYNILFFCFFFYYRQDNMLKRNKQTKINFYILVDRHMAVFSTQRSFNKRLILYVHE